MNPTRPDSTALVEQLRRMPEHSDPAFAFDARKLADTWPDLREQAGSVIEEETLDRKLRYRAFFVLLIRLFRDEDYRAYRQLFERHEALFADWISEIGLRAEYHLTRGDKRGNLEEALIFATEAKERLPNHPLVLHSYAALLVGLEERVDQPDRDHVRDAEHALNKAIGLSKTPHAIFYATKARSLTLLGRYDDARDALDAAIDAEPTNTPQYDRRIAHYHDLRANVSVREHLAMLSKQQSEALRKLEELDRSAERRLTDIATQLTARVDEVRLQLIQLLALLAAVIAFIVTGTQFATKLKFQEAAQLLLFVAGTILMIFASYATVFAQGGTRPPGTRRLLVVFGTGIALLVFGSVGPP